ncbi:alpha/beta hydrolase [Pseudomonas sp. LPB0260]|uniref:alpha/beta hydrolase n=1 Tax=unclassified Pseudomonas TaxID=196821 RepID=UPI0015C231DB|nr:alpha/beta hydrolase [Pseudomonas sp. LPB0260]QLC72875.1 alpha/beta hydrolase [Pseudomonas sp. LPB0260]QLC75649.1 alpha/beta hydrolase [Pseudomonas sp. LPB0260]
MPERFDPEHLRPLLRPLAAATLELPAVQAYRSFYGIDLAQRHARLDCRLGGFSVAGYQIAAHLWAPPEPQATLLLVHGYYDHMGLYRHVVDWALQMNFAVLACDLPGHGLSSGARASIDDFAEYQQVLHGLLEEAALLDLPQPWHLCGQSTGGAILLDYLLNGAPRPEIGQSILLAPLVRPRAWTWSQLSYRLLSPFVKAIPRRFSENSSDPAFIDFVQNRDPLQPRNLPTAWFAALRDWVPRIEAAPRSAHSPLIIQGEADMTVDWQHNLEVLQDKFATPQILRLPEARHHLANEVPALRQRYFDFLRERLA